jgi:hypothetical protein
MTVKIENKKIIIKVKKDITVKKAEIEIFIFNFLEKYKVGDFKISANTSDSKNGNV